MIDYRLIRSERRTLSIQIDREGALVVHAPKHMSIHQIESFIAQKQRWILEKQKAVHAAMERCPEPESGAFVPFWGGELRIEFYGGKKAVCREGVLWLPSDGKTAQHARKWRLQQAEQLITPRVEYWAKMTGLTPSRIAYGSAKTRWGSMNAATRSLRLNAALIHCPQDIVDYVIVHELVHIIHPDHSPAFHAAVRDFLPGADQKNRALRQYAAFLRLWE